MRTLPYPSAPCQLKEFPVFIVIGIVCGLLGALFNSLNRRLTLFRARYIKTKRMKLFEAIAVATLTALLCCLLPLLLPCTAPVFDEGR